MATINPYLNYPGTAEEAFNFYKSVLGGEFAVIQRFKDTQEGAHLSEIEREKLMHIALPIGNGNVLMATDAMESMGHPLTVGNNFYLSLNTDSEEEAARIFAGLSAGGKVEMEMQKTFWNSYFGMFQDKFGIRWMVSYDYNKPQ